MLFIRSIKKCSQFTIKMKPQNTLLSCCIFPSQFHTISSQIVSIYPCCSSTPKCAQLLMQRGNFFFSQLSQNKPFLMVSHISKLNFTTTAQLNAELITCSNNAKQMPVLASSVVRLTSVIVCIQNSCSGSSTLQKTDKTGKFQNLPRQIFSKANSTLLSRYYKQLSFCCVLFTLSD